MHICALSIHVIKIQIFGITNQSCKGFYTQAAFLEQEKCYINIVSYFFLIVY